MYRFLDCNSVQKRSIKDVYHVLYRTKWYLFIKYLSEEMFLFKVKVTSKYSNDAAKYFKRSEVVGIL